MCVIQIFISYIDYPFKHYAVDYQENNFTMFKEKSCLNYAEVNGALHCTEINFQAHSVVCRTTRLKHYTGLHETKLFTIFFDAEFLSWPYKASKPCNFQMIRAIIPNRDFSHRDKSTGIILVMQNQNLSSPTAKKQLAYQITHISYRQLNISALT